MSLRPGPTEIVDSLLWTLEHDVAPSVDDEFARSAATTMRNLLVHLRVRLEREGQALVDDNADLRGVLRALLDSPWGRNRPPEVRAAVEAALDPPPVSPPRWPSVELLADEAHRLRSCLDDLIPATSLDPDADRRVVEYLARQLAREAPWIEGAFSGERR